MESVGEWTVKVRTPDGQGTLSVGIDNVWASLWRRAATMGKPTAAWQGIGFRHLGTPYSFGFFATSAQGGRLFWFPTANVSATLYDEDSSGQLTHYLGRSVDHLTLNPPNHQGRQRSHFTYLDGGHGPNVSHYPRPGYLVPWFTIMLPSLEHHLRPVPQELGIKFPAVRIDKGYPPQLVGDGSWLIVDAQEPPDVPCFVQFDVWAGMRSGWTEDAWNYLPVPHLLGLGDEVGPDIPHRSIGVRIAEDRGVIIILSWIPGELDRPRIMRPSAFDPGTTLPLRVPS